MDLLFWILKEMQGSLQGSLKTIIEIDDFLIFDNKRR